MMLRVLFTLMVCVALMGCEPKSGRLTFESEEMKVDVEAIQEVPLDPWKVTIAATAFEREPTKLQVEMQLEQLNAENVRCEWKKPLECHLVFTQTNGSDRTFRIRATPDYVHIKDISQAGH